MSSKADRPATESNPMDERKCLVCGAAVPLEYGKYAEYCSEAHATEAWCIAWDRRRPALYERCVKGGWLSEK